VRKESAPVFDKHVGMAVCCPFGLNDDPDCEIDCPLEDCQHGDFKIDLDWMHDLFNEEHSPVHCLLRKKYDLLGGIINGEIYSGEGLFPICRFPQISWST
jgi:hypothetical protein